MWIKGVYKSGFNMCGWLGTNVLVCTCVDGWDHSTSLDFLCVDEWVPPVLIFYVWMGSTGLDCLCGWMGSTSLDCPCVD